ncbi:MAG: PadR family transcriptional regulator [Clostridium sp.]|nr:PadR family transcriptional regulator [Clostridium sp.]
MKKGVLEILVLKLLEQHERYGYQLITELKEKSSELFSLKEGTLYPILYRLEEEGLVTSKWSVPQGKELSKKYYTISDAGRQTLQGAVILWKQFSESVNLILEEKEHGTKEVSESDL